MKKKKENTKGKSVNKKKVKDRKNKWVKYTNYRQN